MQENLHSADKSQKTPGCIHSKPRIILKIIHIGPDSQFLQFISKVFEDAAPGANKYLITGRTPCEGNDFQFPVNSNAISISVAGKRGIASIPLHIRPCDIIIVHGMGPHGIAAFLSSPSNAKKIWSGWGYDYYGNDYDADAGLTSEATNELINQNIISKKTISIVERLATQLISYGRAKAASKTDYFSAPIPSDFDIFKQRFNKFKGKYTQINYGSVSDTFAKIAVHNSGNNILVGNSAHKTNNHIDIFKILAKHDIEERKIFTPLNYGDSTYRDIIIKHGRKILGNSFKPITNFIPLNEYNSIVASCNIVIMNHHRQQALGNIGAALYHGAHVFLNTANPIYNFFKKRNAILHSICDLELNSLPKAGLLDGEIATNRAALESFWGNQQIRANIDTLLANAGTR